MYNNIQHIDSLPIGFYDLESVFDNDKKEYIKVTTFLCGRPLMFFDENNPSFIEEPLIYKYQLDNQKKLKNN